MAMNRADDWREGLPGDVVQVLAELEEQSAGAFGADLVAIALFGSAAEGRLRATSDVNVLLVLRRLDPKTAAVWRMSVAPLAAAIELKMLVLLESEIAAAAESFSVKYFDILHRRRIIHGADPFASVVIPREALQRRLGQVLLNLTLRLRQAWLLQTETGQTHALVDAIGPLRAAAAALQELRGREHTTPKEALAALSAEHNASATLDKIQLLRERGDPAAPDAAQLLGELIDFTRAFSDRVAASVP